MNIIGFIVALVIENIIHCDERVDIDYMQVCWVKGRELKKISLRVSAPYDTQLVWEADSDSSKISVIRENSFSSLKNLRHLALNGHGIIYIQPNAFNGLTELTILELNNNNISTKKRLKSHIFAGLPKLRKLILIGAFNRNETELPVGIFDNLPQLKELYVRKNNFEHIPMGAFENLQSLSDLSLKSNNIRTITPGAFSKLRLEYLDLSENEIKVIEANTFNGLLTYILDLRVNSIETIEPGAFNGLKVKDLHLDRNQSRQ